MIRRAPLTLSLWLLSLATMRVSAQSFVTPALDDSTLASSMRSLATIVGEQYRSTNRDSLLDVTFRLDLVRGKFEGAASALRQLHHMRVLRSNNPQTRALNVQFEVVAAAHLRTANHAEPADKAFSAAIDSIATSLDNRTAAIVMSAMTVSRAGFDGRLRQKIRLLRARPRISIAEALGLLRAYQIASSYSELAPFAQDAAQRDDNRRYTIERGVRVPVGDGAVNCVVVVRPRHSPRLPTLLEYTIYADTAATLREMRRAASNDYVAVTAFTRGKLCGDGPIVPYRFDGGDAASVIEWIARQPWSDGRVGMYSGSYEGFTQWSALKHFPRGLKTILAGAAAAPGLDVPAEGNIVWNFIYPWPFYAASNRTLDDADYNDTQRWSRLNRAWYARGSAYRDLDSIDGTPNPIFDDWLAHPSYDQYWQTLIPQAAEYSRVNIPVLQTAGYYFGGPGAALHYFTEHYKYNARAEHYLVIGPWDHLGAQRGVIDAIGDTISTLSNLTIDPVARLSLVSDLRFQWFDYVFKGKPKPALLRDRINYEVVGANEWRHAASIAVMSKTERRWYLTDKRGERGYRLASTLPEHVDSLQLEVNLADRSDADRAPRGGGLLDHAVDTANALIFSTDTLEQTTDIAGLITGRLLFTTNKRDFDLFIQPYELTSDGAYIQLPSYQTRASFAENLTSRHLLVPNVPTSLDVNFARLTAQRIKAGSRLVFVLGVLKGSAQQINYGSGKAVSEETLADAGAALRIQWLPGSFIEVPVTAQTARRFR